MIQLIESVLDVLPCIHISKNEMILFDYDDTLSEIYIYIYIYIPIENQILAMHNVMYIHIKLYLFFSNKRVQGTTENC